MLPSFRRPSPRPRSKAREQGQSLATDAPWACLPHGRHITRRSPAKKPPIGRAATRPLRLGPAFGPCIWPLALGLGQEHIFIGMFPDLTRDDIFHLETKSLWLRWPRAKDAKHITRFASLAQTAEMTAAIPHPYPSGEAERFIFKTRVENASGKGLVLVITQKGRVTQPIGLISVTLSSKGEPELGYFLSPSVWGHGFATEAVRVVLSTLFTLTPIETVFASVRPANIASRRVLEKCGFTYAGTGLEFFEARGGSHLCDRFIFGRTAWARQSGGRLIAPMVQQQPDLFGSTSGAARGGH